jgi:acetyltransferase-like isoleucine patch superfamily enzyme
LRLKNLTEAKARFQSGEVILPTDPAFAVIMPIVGQTLKLVGKLNSSGDIAEAREILSHIFDQEVDESTTVFPPFTTNFGRFTKIGKQVFINHGCSFLDLGGITIEDQVLIGPQVKLVTENHPLDPATRKGLITKPILIRRNAWIGAGAIILPGVTVGENAVIAAGAVVSKDVPDNAVVGGIPARLIKSIG